MITVGDGKAVKTLYTDQKVNLFCISLNLFRTTCLCMIWSLCSLVWVKQILRNELVALLWWWICAAMLEFQHMVHMQMAVLGMGGNLMSSTKLALIKLVSSK